MGAGIRDAEALAKKHERENIDPTINNAIGLLEECLVNGQRSKLHLCAWFDGEAELIKRTAIDLRAIEEGEAGYVDH